MHRVADAISTEARAKYYEALRHPPVPEVPPGNAPGRIAWLTYWSPNINIFRDPRWGRGQETYGEDPYLTSRMGVAFVTGMQGNDPHYLKVVATPKHYAVHSGPEPLRHTFDARVSESDLVNTYLPAFRAAVTEGKADSVMCVYNRVDGVPGCASTDLLQKRLREQWGFKGFVVSDCGAIGDIFRTHKYAATQGEASVAAVKAGTDLTCGGEYRSLINEVKAGRISEAEIDRATERLFEARFRLGMFDPPERVPYAKIPYSENAAGLIVAWYGGEEAGTAIAETLAGSNNPAGRLPITFYKSMKDLPPFEDYSMKGRTYRYFEGQPLYPFGYGLSYSKFAYNNARLSTTTLKAGSDLLVDVDVRNTSAIAGDEVVQAYIEFPKLSGAPLRTLCAFQRVSLQPGQVRHVRLTLTPRDLSLVNEEGARMVAAGAYKLFIGGGQPGTGAPGMQLALTIQGEQKLPQ